MGGSWSERLRKAEEAAERLDLAQRVCPDCNAAIPGIPEHLMIGSYGVLLFGKGCSTCFELGGGAIALDDSGVPKTPFHKLVMMFDPGSGVETFEDWVSKYGHLRFGQPIDAFLRVERAELDGQGDARDLSAARTPEQTAEAKAATRYFPCWDGTVPDQFKDVQFAWDD